MAISTDGPISAVPAPAPKATCANCGRPIVMAKAPTCLYCGAKLQVVQEPLEKPGTLPPHVLLALEPRVRKKLDDRKKWLIRIGASILGSLITGLIMGPCAKLPPPH